MIEFNYLYKGLCGLANAHRASALAGHLGAAVTAGYFFGEDQSDLDDAVNRGVEKELDRIISGEEAGWLDAKKAGVTAPQLFEPLPKEPPREDSIGTIADALAKNIDELRESGHNVIFAAIAIRALSDHSDYATPSIVEGVRRLTADFDKAGPGSGYYGKEKGRIDGRKVTLPDDKSFPPYASEQDLVNVTIDELIATASVRRSGFGGLFHIINHAAALTELSRYGYKDLAKRGLAAHHHHVRLWRSLPNMEVELGAVEKSSHDPRQPDYWAAVNLKRDDARLTHRIKTLYGFFTLMRLIDDEPKRKKAEDSILYLMA